MGGGGSYSGTESLPHHRGRCGALKVIQGIVGPEVVHAFRNLMDCIVVVPTAYREGYVIDVYGRLPAIMGINLFPTMRSAEEILTSEGVSSAVINTTARGQVQRGNTWR
jgi:hypothetical protein